MANCSAKTRQNSIALINSPGIPWGQWPQQQTVIAGIYVIKQGGWVIYVGRTGNLNQRLKTHYNGSQQAIDIHIGMNPSGLTYNYVTDPDQKCNEHCYLHHITQLQGQKPRFNMQGGNSCAPCAACV